ncbi:MAG: DUF883 family protein [Burkholderiales bacterium]|nr:DUF883 family protein [Burkholderiales bacterium]
MPANGVPKERLIDNVILIINELEESMKSVAFETGEKAEALRAKAKENLRIAKERLQDLEDVITERSKAAARATDDYVHAHPWSAVGFALGLGVVIGLLLNRR